MEQDEHHNDKKMMEMAYFFVKNSTKLWVVYIIPSLSSP